MQSVNNKALIEELDKLLERLRIPSEVRGMFAFVYLTLTEHTVDLEQLGLSYLCLFVNSIN